VPEFALARTWLRAFGPAPESAPVVVALPHAGGSARDFAALARELSPAVDLRGVQYPGRQDRFHENCATSVDELADNVAAVVAALHGEGRTVTLLGHSLGAIVAFEVARRAGAGQGGRVAALVVSARPAPSRQPPSNVHALDDERFVSELQQVGCPGVGMLADPGLRGLVLPMLRADFALAETYEYRPGAPLDCPVLALCGDADPTVEPEEMPHWAEHTRGRFVATTVPGGHFSFMADGSGLATHIEDFVVSCSSNVPASADGEGCGSRGWAAGAGQP
jgi:pyochelin biosynthesis protein PchC